MDFLGIGAGEILMIILVAFLLLGPGKVVEFGKNAGKMVRQIKKASSDLTANFTKELEEEQKSLSAAAEKKEPEKTKNDQPPTNVSPPVK